MFKCTTHDFARIPTYGICPHENDFFKDDYIYLRCSNRRNNKTSNVNIVFSHTKHQRYAILCKLNDFIQSYYCELKSLLIYK